MSNSDLTKVYVDLPQHWATGGESLWARTLGDDLYEIDDVPFYAYGINYRDVVRAVPQHADQKPQVTVVVHASGHRTLRFFFGQNVTPDEQLETLEALKQMGLSFERAAERYVAVDVPATADYAAVCSKLAVLETRGLLEYETCEMRVAGRFDLDGTASEIDA